MAVFRKNPKCPYCGEIIAKGIYRDQSNIPSYMRVIGDTFIRWEYLDHTCDGKKKAQGEMAELIDESGIKEKLPQFFKQKKILKHTTVILPK